MRKLNLKSRILLAILSILGFSCDPDESLVEYGMPNADFKVNGTIVDEVSLEKISNIQVIITDPLSSAINGDTAYSDENGNYEVGLNTWPSATAFFLKFTDVDGERNGQYLQKDSLVDFTGIEIEGGTGGWYEGEASLKVDVKLTPDE